MARDTTAVALEIRNLSKTFGRTRVLSKVDLTVGAGEVHALVGENGSGKSTLIKILSGYHDPDPGGEVRIDGRSLELGSAASSLDLGCRFVHQDIGLVGSETIVDNLSLSGGFPRRFGTVRSTLARRRAIEDLAKVGLDIDPNTCVADLSPAMKTGVAVARALRDDDAGLVKLLVLDEPTATLPESEVLLLLDIIRAAARRGVAILYVSHRLDEIFSLASMVTVLRDGHKVAERAVDSLDHHQLIEMMVGHEFDEVRAESSSDRLVGTDLALAVEHLGCGVIADASISVFPGEIVGIAGVTGSGRETVLSAVFGGLERDAGSVKIDGISVPPLRPDLAIAQGMAYLPADRKIHGGMMTLTASENLTLTNLRPLWRSGRLRRALEVSEARSWFQQLGVRPADGVQQPLATFSGGNQQKILFGKWLRREPRVLLLDEPTQGVDVGAKADLHRQLLRAAGNGAAIVISGSDADELAAICSRVLVFRSGRIAAELTGPEISARAISSGTLGDSERKIA
jgi:ribose transport system ATP-binding protein